MKTITFLRLFSILGLISLTQAVSGQINVLTEDFEGTTFNVSSSSASGNNNNAWAINSYLFNGGSKSDSAKVTLGDTLYLETNAFSTVGFSNVSLAFDQICKIDFFDRSFMEYSNDNGTTWVRLTSAEYNGSGFFSSNSFSAVSYPDWNPASANAIPTNTWWKTENFNLTATAGNTQVKVRWMLVDADNNGAVGNYGWLLDNIVITAAPCELVPPTIVLTGTVYQGLVYSQGPYRINATITDASGVASATLTYTLNNGSPIPIAMSNPIGNTWGASMPAAAVGDTICYFISAVDNTTCSNTANFPSSGCIQFIVGNNPPPSCLGTPVFTFNYLESFASFTAGNGANTVGTLQNNWFNDNTDSHDWYVLNRATNSGGTGPTADHSPGDDNYLYVEASGNTNSTAILNTPCYDFSNLNAPKFDFYYHMLGAAMGELHVDVFFGGQWILDVTPAIIGNQGNNWNYRRVDLTAYAGNIVKLRFRAITGNGFTSDIAIDDIEIIEPLAKDVGITNIYSPSATGCVGTSAEFVTFEISSNGATPLDTIPMAYRVNGGAVVRDTLFQRMVEGDTLNFTFQQTVNMSTVGNYAFQFWMELAGDEKTSNDSILTYALSTSNVIGLFPDTNNFDAFTVGTPGVFFDGWTNDPNGDNHDWYVNTGATPSNNTGPTSDHTSGSGNYLFVEASTFANQQANLFSKCLDLNNLNQPELTFYYHMFGATMGELHFDININGVTLQDIAPAKIGSQANSWVADTIDLTPYKGNVKLIFRAIVGSNFTSDIALDDIVIRDANPVGLQSIQTSTTSIEVFPNPADDLVNVLLKNKGPQLLSIYNSVGSLVWEATSNSTTPLQINVSNWSKGIYQIRISNGEQISVEKLIVR